MSTFGALDFQSERGGSTLAGATAQAEIATQHVPGSNINVVDIGGLRESRIVRRIMVEEAQLGGWLAARLTTAELTLETGSQGSCLLAQLLDREGEIADPFHHFTAEWIVL